MATNPITDARALSNAVRKPFYDRCLIKTQNSDEMWRWRVIFGLAALAFEHYDALEKANSEPSTLTSVAFHARCLMELVIWTNHALKSDENMHQVDADYLNNGMDLIHKLKSYSKGPEHFDADMAIKRLSETASKEGHKEPQKKHLETRDLAGEAGREFFDLHNKILSKLMHVSGFTIVGINNDGAAPEIRLKIYSEACSWFSAIIQIIAPFVDLEIAKRPEE